MDKDMFIYLDKINNHGTWEIKKVDKYIFQFSQQPTDEEIKAIREWESDPGKVVLILGPHVTVYGGGATKRPFDT